MRAGGPRDGPAKPAAPAGPDRDAERDRRVGAPGLLAYGSVAAGLLLLVKAYGVAHYSLTTAGKLATVAPVTVVLGTLASYAYMALALLAVTLVWWLWEHRHAGPGSVRAVALAGATLATLLAPAVYLWPTAAVAGAVVTVTGLARARGVRWDVVRRPLPYFCVGVAAWFFVTTLDKPWMPAEVLVLDRPALVGAKQARTDPMPVVYVLSDDGRVLTALNSDNRYIVQVPSATVRARIVCHFPSQPRGHRPLLSLLQGRPYSSPNTLCSGVIERLRDGRITP